MATSVVECRACNRYWRPEALGEEGACPTCGAQLEGAQDSGARRGAPWHFKLLVGALALYLVWRLVQIAAWLLERI